MNKGLLSGLLLAISLVLAPSAFSQDTATLTGMVTDPTGAVVVGAQVTISNVATNIETATQTNTQGLYRVPALRPGTYRIAVSAAGFKRFVRENIDLRVGDTVPINAALEIGTVADTVEVTAAVPLLETETSSTGTVVKGEFFYRMPLYQRWAKSVFYLTPGVTVQGYGNGGLMSNFSINGESTNNIGYFEDGIYGVRPTGGMTTDTIQNTIEEIKVITTVLPAEFGHSSGGAVTVVKKSGTNQLHGLVSELFRERPMQHRRFMQIETFKQAGTSLHFHMPDANLSGPVYLPKIYDGRNKTFFMLASQFLIERQGEQVTASVPTAAELSGDFTYAGMSGVTPNPIFDPRTTYQDSSGQWFRNAYPGNIIPKASWDAVARNFLSKPVWKDPNRTGTPGQTGYTDNLIASRQKAVDYYSYTARVDHQLTQAVKTFATWSYNTREYYQPNIQYVDLMFDSSARMGREAQTTSGIGGTWIPAPTVVSETRLSYYRYKNTTTWPGFGIDYGKLLGIPNIGAGSMPSITGIPYVSNPSIDVQETINLKQDVSKLYGSHAFKTGYDLMRLRRNSYSITNNAGTFTLMPTNRINTNGSSVPNTGGNSLTQLMSGAVSGYTLSTNLLSTLPRNWIHGLYFQDDWKVRPNLTLNLGVRWQVQSAMNNKYGQQSSFDPTAADNVVAGARGVITHPGSVHKKDWNNFQPRVGLAWTAFSDLVIRAGFALSTTDERLPSPPTDEYGSITARIDTPSGNYLPRFLLQNGPLLPLVWPEVRADGSIPFSGTNYGSRSANWVDTNRKSPYSMNWNFSVQRGLGSNYLVEAMYSGNRGVSGFENWQVNTQPYDWAWNLRLTNPSDFSKMEGNSQAYRPFANFGGITYRTNGADSVYHAGTIKLQKRYSYGLSFLTYYTYAKNISASTSDSLIPRSLDRARTGGDRTHQYVGTMNYEIPIGKGRKWLNQGGVWNAVFGGYDMVFIYRISSGNPLTFGMAGSPYKYMPGIVATRSGRPNSTGQRARLRDGWADIGNDRFTRANQNKMIESMSYFTYPAAYTQGNVGARTMDAQRFIDNQFSASKEWKVKERYTLQFRYDFQNPFKWYNLSTPDTTVNFTNPANFGTVSTDTGAESTTATGGGQPMMNITIAVRW
ncbi:MAG: TonB-dependent receptor [Bryobacterales bacterium]|nr:TonB-dependent receptor [Bryobacterales bacterium]